MDDGGHPENGRHKPDQYKAAQTQWMMQHQPSMKQIMAIMAERDGAIHERNLALSEKKQAMAERDIAIHQRDLAIAERNNAIMERDNAIATFQYRETAFTNSDISSCPPNCQISRGVKHMHHPQQHVQHVFDMSELDPTSTTSPLASDPPKPRQQKRQKEAKKPSKPSKKLKIGNEDELLKHDWKGHDLGLNQVAFDDSTMAPPVCSCTGIPRQCYKWGSGGWQSSCCTNTVSMYPLPNAPNKRHARVGGRKMSGGAFSKLLSRLAAEGHDLSNPVDLKDNWAKHGTNRYITIK